MSNMKCNPMLHGITNKSQHTLAMKEKVVNKQLDSNDVTYSKSNERSSKPIHISIQPSFNCLSNAREEDSSCIPTILLSITISLCIRYNMQILDSNSTHMDIVPFLK